MSTLNNADVLDAKIPPRSHPIINISSDLIWLIQSAAREKESNGTISKSLRLEIVECALDYLVEMGVHPTLLQYGDFSKEGESDVMQYFFAGNFELSNGDSIKYEELPQNEGQDIFQAVVTKKV